MYKNVIFWEVKSPFSLVLQNNELHMFMLNTEKKKKKEEYIIQIISNFSGFLFYLIFLSSKGMHCIRSNKRKMASKHRVSFPSGRQETYLLFHSVNLTVLLQVVSGFDKKNLQNMK